MTPEASPPPGFSFWADHDRNGRLGRTVVRASSFLFVMALLCISPSALGSDADPWIARDKALHFDATAGIASVTYAVSAGWLVDARWKALAVGGCVAITAGAAKEVVDALHILGGDPSWKDFAWDAIGTVVGLALAWGIDLLLGGVGTDRPAFAPPLSSGAR
jgi:uncharacterized protein YfiM (DUF2279 family)